MQAHKAQMEAKIAKNINTFRNPREKKSSKKQLMWLLSHFCAVGYDAMIRKYHKITIPQAALG